MKTTEFADVLSKEALLEIFPAEKSGEFFDALLGDADDGAYNIELAFRSATESQIIMELNLIEKPGCCLACNLTHGLPNVFSRHPVINAKGTVEAIDKLIGDSWECTDWKLGGTEQLSHSRHCIPMLIDIKAV